MKIRKLAMALLVSAVLVACGGDNKKKGADYSIIKTELKLEGDKAKKFDEIVAKYEAQRTETRKAMGEKPDRVALFKKMEEFQKQQDDEVAKLLTADELQKYKKFVDENTRKRPRYNDELLAKIKTEVALTDEQMQTVNAANDAFEKMYHDAHDIYHGNPDLAKEYWEKFDAQRKEAIKGVLSPEQYQKFTEVVKDVKFVSRSKK
ncbi:MAG: hypothetical protein Q4C75_00385 [Bergeyella zoohelcum]|nr:hypothetical protein [Bergeyella zoohelcum]